jgi:hypothetical protein
VVVVKPGTGSAMGDGWVFDGGSFIIYDVCNGKGKDFHWVVDNEGKDGKQNEMLGVHSQDGSVQKWSKMVKTD